MKLRRRWLVAGAVAAACLLVFLFQGRNPSRIGPSLRMPASSGLQLAGERDLPALIENRGEGSRIWAVRDIATSSCLSPAFAEAVQFVLDSPHFLEPGHKPGGLQILAPVIVQEGIGTPDLFALQPPGYAEALDASGRPLRWNVPEHIIASYSVARPVPFAAPGPAPGNPRFAADLARLAPSRNAGDYRRLVESFASRYGLNTDLVMAIIHSESNFTPTLVSPKSAMGLMQLLPSTASDEVHRFLYGRRGQVNYEQLSVPEINIRYGTAYLHILNNRYFSNVRDRQVREACVIAAYNMGPNGFLRLYGARPEEAVAKINSMGSDEFHEDLQRRLPMRETRFYVEKVKRMKQHYAGTR